MAPSGDLDSSEALARVCQDTWVQTALYFDSLESTNDYSLSWARQGSAALPALVLAGAQTRGRGRGAHRWWTGRGALTFSLVLDPERWQWPPARWPSLSLVTAISLGDAVAAALPTSRVQWKWPNDLFLEGRKVAGILLEVASSRPPRIIVGVGLNVNNPAAATAAAACDPALLRSAISICEASGRLHAQSEILRSFLDRFHELMVELSRSPQQLPDLWRPRSLLHGRQVTIRMGSRTVRGRAGEIGPDGTLYVQTAVGVESCAGGIVLDYGAADYSR